MSQNQPESMPPRAQKRCDLGQGLGSGLRLLSLYRCQDALAAFQRLPPSQKSTGVCPH